MREYKQKELLVTKTVLEKITCDKCEKEIKIVYPEHNFEGVLLKIDAGYGSRHDLASDMCNWTFDVCDDCCEEFVKSFKKDYLNPGEDPETPL